jgi:hypothetical protein
MFLAERTIPKIVLSSQCDSRSESDEANQLPCWNDVLLSALSGSGLSVPDLELLRRLRRDPADGSTDRERGLVTGPAQPSLYSAGTRNTVGVRRPAPTPVHRASSSRMAALSPLGFADQAIVARVWPPDGLPVSDRPSCRCSWLIAGAASCRASVLRRWELKEVRTQASAAPAGAPCLEARPSLSAAAFDVVRSPT